MNKEAQNAEVIPTVGDSLAALANAMHIGIFTKATDKLAIMLPDSNGCPRPIKKNKQTKMKIYVENLNSTFVSSDPLLNPPLTVQYIQSLPIQQRLVLKTHEPLPPHVSAFSIQSH